LHAFPWVELGYLEIFMLRQAYQFIQDKNIFRFMGKKNEQDQLKEMLQILLKTKIGRTVINDIGTLMKGNPMPITIKMVKPDPDILGTADRSLTIRLGRTSIVGLNTRQRNRVLLMQSLTLLHELVHIRQFLHGEEETIQKFSVPHQLYANICEEMESSTLEKMCEIEFRKLYPTVTRTMRLQQATPKWKEQFMHSFFKGKRNKNESVLAWVDLFMQQLRTQQSFTVQDAAEKNFFECWINRFFRKTGFAHTYRDLPMEQTFWATSAGTNSLVIKGADYSLTLDSKGRPLLLLHLPEAKSTAHARIYVYTFNDSRSIHSLVQKAQRNNIATRISLIKGPKQIKLSSKSYL